MRAAGWAERRGWRAYLFVPPRLLSKASNSDLRRGGPLIIDLEDAVAEDDKDGARDDVERLLASGPPVYVRINASSTRWFRDDLRILGRGSLLGALLAKAEEPDAVAEVAASLDDRASVIPLIETASGVERVEYIARSPRVERLAFGALDFRRDLRLGQGWVELLYARSRIVTASRAGGLLRPIDSPELNLTANGRLALQARRARRLGFGAKLCVHPKQVPVVNRCLAPEPDMVAWARRVLEVPGYEPRRVDGEMVDRPIVEEASQVLEEISWPSSPDS